MTDRFTIKETVTHQNIGGKEFQIETEISIDEVIFKGLFEGNWACRNFLERRNDIDKDFPHKLYYGKVNNLGYIISEDEFKD